MALITMSQKEIDRYEIVKRLMRKEIDGPCAAKLLNISTRQVRRLKSAVRKNDSRGLIHGNRGKKSNHQIPGAECQRIIALLHRHYSDFRPGFACEKLRERHSVKRDPKTIRQIMISEGLWKPRRGKNKSEHREWRQRKSSLGEMIQFDGSYESWLEDRGPICCLLAAIDDATSAIQKAVFAKDEGVFPVFGFWRDYILTRGKPRNIYLDKFSTYKMNSAFAQENHELKTQFERAMIELRVETIFANSPQAKGRVERLFGTLQDRLIKELRLEKISTIEEANQFLKEIFIPKFNVQFAVEPMFKVNLHAPLAIEEKKKLDSIFSRQEKRVVQNDFTLSFKKQWYQLTKEQPVTVCKKDVVVIEERLDGSVWIRLRDKHLNYETLPARPVKQKIQPWVLAAAPRAFYKPPADHPWRKKFILPAPSGRYQTSSQPPNPS